MTCCRSPHLQLHLECLRRLHVLQQLLLLHSQPRRSLQLPAQPLQWRQA